MSVKSLDAILIFIVGLGLFTIGLSSQEIISFEARFYLFALEMWRHGPTLFPTTYHKPYPDYPVTSTYLIYLASRLFGYLNKFTAVFPSACAAALTLVVTYLIGARYSRQWGLSAVIFLFFTLTFITEARTISLDQYVTLITVMCFYIVETKRTRSGWLWITILLAAAFAVRGPIGIIIPTGVLCVFFLLEKKVKPFFMMGIVAIALLILCSLILLALAHHVGGESFVKDVIRMQVGSRMEDAKMPPLFFYFTESIGGYAVTYPLAVFMIAGCIPLIFKKSVTREAKLLQKCLAWSLVILIGMSIPADKKMRYILPLAPALALFCAYLFSDQKLNRYLHYVRQVFKGVCFILPLVALIFIFILYKKNIHLHYSALAAVFIILQIALVLRRKHQFIVLSLGAITFFIANVWIVEVINLNTNQTRDFVLHVETLREKNQTPLVFFQEGADGLPIKYLINMPTETFPVYLYQPNDLLKLKPHTFVIVGEENFPHIPPVILQHFNVRERNKIGHDKVVVLEKLSS